MGEKEEDKETDQNTKNPTSVQARLLIRSTALDFYSFHIFSFSAHTNLSVWLLLAHISPLALALFCFYISYRNFIPRLIK